MRKLSGEVQFPDAECCFFCCGKSAMDGSWDTLSAVRVITGASPLLQDPLREQDIQDEFSSLASISFT